MTIDYLLDLYRQIPMNEANAFVISLIGGRVFFHKYKLTRDSIVGTTLIILCVWKIYELVIAHTAVATLSSVAGNLFLFALVYRSKGNIVNVFRKVSDEQLQIQPEKRK